VKHASAVWKNVNDKDDNFIHEAELPQLKVKYRMEDWEPTLQCVHTVTL